MKNDKIRPFCILIGGYINLNVIDGSAFFLSGLTRMLAEQPYVQVTLVSARPLTQYEVVHEILHLPNVKIIDPYSATFQNGSSQKTSARNFTREEYAGVLNQVFNSSNFDAAIVRDVETCYEMIKKNPSVGRYLSCYVTGITSLTKPPTAEIIHQLSKITRFGGKLIAQTPAMGKLVEDIDFGVPPPKVFILPPHVPDAEKTFEELYPTLIKPTRLVYTGKFFKAWNIDKILSAFKSNKVHFKSDLTLEVAGDQFRGASEDPNFVTNTKYLLDSTPGLRWHGRVPRSISRKIISRSHVGISWRATELDDSAELSTKILEYGAMGVPSILNRNALHEELLGNDYPLFANTMTDFKLLVDRLPSMGKEVRRAAKLCYELSSQYWFSAVAPSLLSHLGNNSQPGIKATMAIPISADMSEYVTKIDPRIRTDAQIIGALLMLKISETGEMTVEEAISFAEFQYLSWKKASETASLIFMNSAQLSGETKIPLSSEPSMFDKLRDAELRAQEYKEELEVLRKKMNKIKNVVRKVDESPLGPAYRKIRRTYLNRRK